MGADVEGSIGIVGNGLKQKQANSKKGTQSKG